MSPFTASIQAVLPDIDDNGGTSSPNPTNPVRRRSARPATSPTNPADLEADRREAALIAAVMGQLERFPGGRATPTYPVGDNPKLPMWSGGCTAAITDIAQVREAFSRRTAYGRPARATGYAFYPPPGIVVFDVDNKHGKDGDADLAYCEGQYGPLPRTATVATPSGGWHLYVRLPRGVVLPHVVIGKLGRPRYDANGKRLPTGIDIFGYHPTKSLWVAGPGTVTPKGEYRWAEKASGL